MIGAIIGDIVGSRFEFQNIHTKNFLLFSSFSHITDDSILTMAIAKALVTCKDDYSNLSEVTIECLRKFGKKCQKLSRIVTEVTHNHPEGIKGAEAIAVCVWLARNGKTKDEIRTYVNNNYYPMNFTLENLQEN